MLNIKNRTEAINLIKKSISFFMGVIVGLGCFIFSGCAEKYNFEDVRAEFSQYQPDPNLAVILDGDIVYFYDHEIHLRDLVTGDITVRDLYVSQKDIFFSASHFERKDHSYIGSVALYQCDLYGNDIQKLYEKGEIESLDTLRNKDVFYFQYVIDDVMYIDSYDIFTGESKNMDKGKECNVSDYSETFESDYVIEQKNGEASISERSSSTTVVLDDDYLKTTPYYGSICKYPYNLEHVRENDGKLYAFYRLKIENFFDVTPKYTYAVFEFAYGTKEMTYKMLVQFDDVEVYEVVNIKETSR